MKAQSLFAHKDGPAVAGMEMGVVCVCCFSPGFWGVCMCVMCVCARV